MTQFRQDAFAEGAGHKVIRAEDLSTPDARRSRPVSMEEFQQIAAEGAQRMREMHQEADGTAGLDRNWSQIIEHAYRATREPWGGVTIHSATGRPLNTRGNSYALSATPGGTDSVIIHPKASKEDFAGSMSQARDKFGEILARKDHHLGVFHDDDRKAIEVDPIVIAKNRADVERIGSFTHATGGAYHFRSGKGFWPPHVVDD